jgi:hypothetical protein
LDNHPIPQDITGFQFKLVGKMTVRQFIYVGTGVLLAWLVYFILKFPFIISLPLALFFTLGGLALAFLPVNGRPLDVMIANFLKAVFAPTQYTYGKQAGTGIPSPLPTINQNPKQSEPAPAETPQFTPQAPPYIQTPTAPPAVQQEPVAGVAPQEQSAQIGPQHTESPIPFPTQAEPLNVSASVSQDSIREEEREIESNEQTIEKQISAGQNQNRDTSELQRKLDEILKQKEELEKELSTLKTRLNDTSADIQNQNPPSAEISLPTPPPTAMPELAVVPGATPPPAQTQVPSPAQMPTPSPTAQPAQNTPLDADPNLVKGVVKDSRGNPLQNILVEVKDEEDNPVRAFKTNGKGEFASATSLANGHYIVVLEDPKMVHKFDTLSIDALGAPLAPLEVISIDPREELRRELFN